MSDFKAKMHQIQFQLGLCSRPAEGAYSAPPDPLAGFKAYFYGRGGQRRMTRSGRPSSTRTNNLWQTRIFMHTLWSTDSQAIKWVALVPYTRCQILRLKCTKFDYSTPRPP